MTTLADDLVPDELLGLVAPLLPAPPRPPYGGRHRTVSDWACLAAIVFMARTSTPWRLLPARELGCGSPTTCWRRLTEWANAGVFDALHLVVLDRLGMLWDGYDPIRDTQSELGAVGSPYRLVMNLAGFMGLGVSILTFTAAYFLLLAPSWAKVLATGLLALAGLGMVVVGFFPCDAGCVDVTATGRLHSVFSMPGGDRPARCGHAVGPAVSARWEIRPGLAGGLVLAGAGRPSVGAAHCGRVGRGVNRLLQRAAMWVPLVWMMAVSIKLCLLARSATSVAAR